MCQGAFRRLCNLSERCHVRKVTRLLARPLSRFPPRVAVIQCGVDNPYGHPTPETLDRLQRAGARVFRNDEDGDVIATIVDEELKVAVTKR
jgi:beta-lactamase superfamily II metal-dependent hydrolase